jgi:SAM-dependent methyltransferase
VSAASSYAERFPPPERPWTQEYVDTHRALVSAAMDDPELAGRFRDARELPSRYAVGFDERTVELPWLLAGGLDGRALDAGSALNHAHVLDRVLDRVESLDVVTLEPEEVSFPERRVSYVYADLRELPYRDGWFRTVVSISTLEHVGMDNRIYGVEQARAADPDREVSLALGELRRVLAPGGTLYMTVPYGAAEDHGWFRQYGQDDLERLVAAAGAPAVVTVYAYGLGGWQVSDPQRAGSASYRDFLADPSPVADLAAAARAVACLRLDY